VADVVSGYSGGTTLNPTYEDICTGRTGHAEVIKITYDPSQVSYAKLLETFGLAHDPTTLNQQGADFGTQYRSVIMYHDEEQKAEAEKWKLEVAKEFTDPIVTEIVAAPVFYPAEIGHQDYFRLNPNARYCTLVIRPKLDKVKKAQKEE
jgi:peptide-methionine (S)-S-oxide reductase